ncbi:CpsD/CapB family tyrosine-protein kinase [Aerococcus vaginalis]
MFHREEHDIERKNREQHLGSALMTYTEPNGVIAEQFRTIRTNIKQRMLKNQTRTVMFTSSGPYEGKSMVASNVAVAMAKLEHFRVLYIDADMRKPTAHKTFDIHSTSGLSGVLIDRRTEFMSVTEYIPEMNLYVLPAGPVPSNPAELLSSDRMAQLIQQAENMFDLVIVDSPPVLVVTDAQLIGDSIDSVAFVIREGVAKQHDLYKAKQVLENIDSEVLGVVYNGATGNARHSYYGYGYGVDDDLRLDD